METAWELVGVFAWPMIGGATACLLIGGGIWLAYWLAKAIWAISNQWDAKELTGTMLKSFFAMGLAMTLSRLAYGEPDRIVFITVGMLLMGLFLELMTNLLWRGWMIFFWPAYVHFGQALRRMAHSLHR